MFDCMEALGMGPRQLYDVTSHGACMLRKVSPFFAGLDSFTWTGSASVPCKWHPVWTPCIDTVFSLSLSQTHSHFLSSLISLACLPQGSARGLLSRAAQEKTGTDNLLSSPLNVCVFVCVSVLLCVSISCESKPMESGFSDVSYLRFDLAWCCVLKTNL